MDFLNLRKLHRQNNHATLFYTHKIRQLQQDLLWFQFSYILVGIQKVISLCIFYLKCLLHKHQNSYQDVFD